MTDPASHHIGPFTLSITDHGLRITGPQSRILATIDPAAALAAARWVLKALGER